MLIGDMGLVQMTVNYIIVWGILNEIPAELDFVFQKNNLKQNYSSETQNQI